MQRFTVHRFAAAAVAVLIVSIVVLSGCSRNPLSTTTQTTEPHLLTRSASLASGSLSPVNLYTEKVIRSTEGGSLSLLDVTLTIPAGAVPNDTLFSISIPDDEVFFNEFGTSGLVFQKPVTVTMSYRNADLSNVTESSIRIAWLDESTKTWKSMNCTVDTVNKTVTGQLSHFSAYGLISD